MLRRFDRAYLAVLSAGSYGESRFINRAFKLRIHFVIAKEFFSDYILLVKRMQIRSWPDANFRDLAGKFWRILCPVGDRAGHRRNHDVLRIRIILRRIRVLHAQDIARTLYQSVLKSPSCAYERPVATAGEFDPPQHSVEAFIGTPWPGPKPVERSEFLF